MNWIFKDNINTDLITPGRYNVEDDPKKLAKIAFCEYLPEFSKKVKEGDFIIAGKNFGCGSSRETAVISLKACKIKAIFAKSFNRIFYRNCLNHGLLAIEANLGKVGKKDKLILDLKNKILYNKTKKKKIKLKIPDLMIKSYLFGGLLLLLKKHGFEAIEKGKKV